MNAGHRYFLISAIALVLTPLWIWSVAPSLTKLQPDFRYEADIFSLDNFYDESSGVFLGESISKTKFYYEVVSVDDGAYRIKNGFDVFKMTGERIISIERMYGIDPETGEHVRGKGDRDRSGYLFAPRRANRQSFDYWHINYNVPARMAFRAEEKIHGLDVHRHECDLRADQSEDLSHLPGVPGRRGVTVEATVTLWIEPVTGRLVNYQDRATAYFYDRSTGKRLNPWNAFGNRFTENSVNRQVREAATMKRRFNGIERTIPMAFVALATIFFLLGLIAARSSSGGQASAATPRSAFFRPRYAVLAGFVAAIFCLSYVFLMKDDAGQLDKPRRIAVMMWESDPEADHNIAGFVEELAAQGMKEGAGLEIIRGNAGADKDKLRVLLRSTLDQGAVLLYVLTTRAAIIAKGMTTDVPVVFSDVAFPVEAGIVGSIVNSGNNLVGTRGYVPASQQFHVFEGIAGKIGALGFVYRKGDPDSILQLQEFERWQSAKGRVVRPVSAVDIDDLAARLESSGPCDAYYTACDPLIRDGGDQRVIEYAAKKRKPVFACRADSVRKGAVCASAVDAYALGRLSGEKAALILNGAKPSWIRTEIPRSDNVLINSKTAAALGLRIPAEVLHGAAEIIQ